MVLRRPSSNEVRGCQSSNAPALVMSGLRCVGSSTGSGSLTISELEPVTSTASSASSRTVYSDGFPMFTGPT